MKFFYSDISTIYYEKLGSGDSAVIFLHGFGASSYSWLYIKEYLEKSHFTSYLVDLKGHGYSSYSIGDDYSIFDQAKMILEFIEYIKSTQVILVGHSYGGGIALTAAISSQKYNDKKIKEIVVIDPAAFADKIPFFIKVMQNPIKRWLSNFFFSSTQRATIVLRSLYHDRSLLTNEMIQDYAKFYSGDQWDTIIKIAKNIIPDNYNNIINAYPLLQIPVFIIWGEYDPIFPKSLGERLTNLIPQSQLHVIPDTGHIPHEEKPVYFFELLSKYIKS